MKPPLPHETDWKEALKSAITSHRHHVLEEWELALIGRRVALAIEVAKPARRTAARPKAQSGITITGDE